MQPLKQSTAATVRVGPFLDSTDGNTEEAALSIATTDVRLSKDGAAFAAQDAGATSPTHDENGHYQVNLTATDTDTLGTLRLYIHVAGALYVRETFTVLPANVYDSLVAGSDSLQTDAVAISGASAAADSVEANIGNLDAAVSSRSDFDEATDSVTAGTVSDKTGYKLASDGVDQVTVPEPSSVPVWGSVTLKDAIGWVMAFFRNKVTQTATTQTLRNDADNADIASASVSDDGTTATRNEFS